MSNLKKFKNKKIAIYGGSFNPIHIGHLLTGYDVLEKLCYDYILYIPANIPVHKDFKDGIDGKLRLEMVKLATKEYEKFLYSDIEIKRGGLTYTYDTVKELQQKFGFTEKFGVIFGDDLLEGLDTWKNISELEKMTELICLKRDKDIEHFSKYKVKFVENRIFNITSSEIRERVKKNQPINYFMTNTVKNFIIKNKLYY
ncbi:MAG TPA: nicotinate-nucleotide adenylyltransferase [Spirochaetota bacterium]|nr:nicotinate-nucleotide adenylyltransferase [Spirochaetota bacterium]